MLTVKEINEVSFGKAGFSGYKPEDVDTFIDEVAASFQELEKARDAAQQQAADLAQQNAQLSAKVAELTAKNGDSQKKLSILAQKIESYREEEEGIKEALLSAQKLAKESVQEARDKAAIMLADAQDSAKQILDEAQSDANQLLSDAKAEAAKTAGEYMAQAETKKAELEEIKRQVSAFKVSLLEMYKKHLECIDHIPAFRQKEKDAETAPAHQEEAAVAQEQKLLEQRQAEQRRKMEEEREAERQRQIEQQREAERQRQIEQQRAAERQRQIEQQREAERQRQIEQQREAERQRQIEQQREAERQRQIEQQRAAERQRQVQARPRPAEEMDYVQEQLQPSMPQGDYMDDDDLAGVGIDIKTYSNIPESLRREKDSHYSNLEFGDGVELDPKEGRKRKR